MRRIVYVLFSVFLLMGCGFVDVNNNPTQRVENFLGKYQRLDESILYTITDTVNQESELTDEQKENYTNLLKDQYRNLMYDVKDSMVDGNEATVSVMIEVRDYEGVLSNADKYLADNPDLFEDEKGNFDPIRYMGYKLEQMSRNNDKKNYTLNLKVHRDSRAWIVSDLTENDIKKIQGIYMESGK